MEKVTGAARSGPTGTAFRVEARVVGDGAALRPGLSGESAYRFIKREPPPQS